MSNTPQHKKVTHQKCRYPSWDAAILGIEGELFKMKEYVGWLKSAQFALRRSRDSGVPWPGSIQAMMDKFDAGVSAKKKIRRTAKAAA